MPTPGNDGGADPFAGARIARVPAPRAVADVLRDMILNGTLPPGQALREATIGPSLGVSRNTLREALQVLLNEGLVTHRPHHGVVVAQMSPADVRDLFSGRRAIELRAADVCGEATKEQLEAVDAERLERDAAVDKEEWMAAFDADIRFHQAIVRLIGSRRIDAFFIGLLRELRLAYHRLDGFENERLKRDRRQHLQLFKAFRAGDSEQARQAVLAHLEDAETLLLKLLGRQVELDEA